MPRARRVEERGRVQGPARGAARRGAPSARRRGKSGENRPKASLRQRKSMHLRTDAPSRDEKRRWEARVGERRPPRDDKPASREAAASVPPGASRGGIRTSPRRSSMHNAQTRSAAEPDAARMRPERPSGKSRPGGGAERRRRSAWSQALSESGLAHASRPLSRRNSRVFNPGESDLAALDPRAKHNPLRPAHGARPPELPPSVPLRGVTRVARRVAPASGGFVLPHRKRRRHGRALRGRRAQCRRSLWPTAPPPRALPAVAFSRASIRARPAPALRPHPDAKPPTENCGVAAADRASRGASFAAEPFGGADRSPRRPQRAGTSP